MKKKVKRIIAGLLFCIIFVGCGKFFRYILIDDTAFYFNTRVTFHEMYEQDNIDVLFVGSSHCYRSFVPEILDKELGENTFNAGTSGQGLDGSCMIIKEAAKYNDIKHIYLELYNGMAGVRYKERTEMTQTYIISDYLRPSFDKVLYLLNASSKQHYVNSFIPARRNWSKFFDADYVKDLIVKKRAAAYQKYEYEYLTGESQWYGGKGYVASNSIVDNWNYFGDVGDINTDNISEDWFHSLMEIISFCDKKDIPLTLVVAPMPNYLAAAYGDYDEYVKLIRSIIAEPDIKYYDFNLCKEEYFPNTSALFADNNHLNCYGAETFSLLFADFINGGLKENELFYDSYAEKLRNLKPTVFGIKYYDSEKENGELLRNCKVISTESPDMEYKICVYPEEGESYIIQDFLDNQLFTVPTDEHGTISIAYRIGEYSTEVHSVDISY